MATAGKTGLSATTVDTENSREFSWLFKPVSQWRKANDPCFASATTVDTENSREFSWLFKPVSQWRKANDPFFAEGNKVCNLVSKQIVSDVLDEETGTLDM